MRSRAGSGRNPDGPRPGQAAPNRSRTWREHRGVRSQRRRPPHPLLRQPAHSFTELDISHIRHGVERIVLSVHIARLAKDALQSTGSLLLIGGTGGRRPTAGPLISAVTAAMPVLARSLALELAPIRVNLIAPGFVDTPLSAAILGDGLDARREQLRATLPIRRVVGPEDVAALAVHLMTNTAVTGATFDIDGGQQLVES